MTGKRVVMSAHARWRAQRRGVEEATVIEIATVPEQVMAVRPGREIRQARRGDPKSGREYVVRVVVDTGAETDTVVTVYRSSKLDKYWRTS
ncbi:DUF4258 domain-containing protein [Nitrospira calida]|jgi:hypothetical protein|nr:hypothetical protein [Burkholderiales bacterium]